MHSILINSS